MSGLVNMGFREREARRALEVVSRRQIDGHGAMPIHEVFREALAVLT
jgi:hypothetical protein